MQQLYKNIGKHGQKKLVACSISIVGIGALGSVASELLARAGIGKLTLIDRDFVELTNLQRQLLFNEEDIGKAKAICAQEKLSKINSEINIIAHSEDINYTNIDTLIQKPDLILGCTDNMESRFLINDYSLKFKIPWIYGAVIAERGYLFNIIPGRTCFRCIFKGAANETCETEGILNANSTIIGSMMSNEAIKIITGNNYENNLLYTDVWKNELSKIKVRKRNDCETCSKNYMFLDGENGRAVKLCGNHFQINGRKINLDTLENRFNKLGKTIRFKGILHFNELTLFENGRALIRAENERRAKSIYSRYVGN